MTHTQTKSRCLSNLFRTHISLKNHHHSNKTPHTRMQEDIFSMVVNYQVEDAPRENGRTRRISKILLGCYKACLCCRLPRNPRTPTANTTNTDKRPMEDGDEVLPLPSSTALHSAPTAPATPKRNVDDCSPKKDQIPQHRSQDDDRSQDDVLASERGSKSPPLCEQQQHTKRQDYPRPFVSALAPLGAGEVELSPARSPHDSPLYTMHRLQTTMVVTPSVRSLPQLPHFRMVLAPSPKEMICPAIHHHHCPPITALNTTTFC